MFDIQVSDEQTRLKFDDTFVASLVQSVLELERVRTARISVAVITDELMHELNRRHLNHDYPTDVLSFVLHSVSATPPDGPIDEVEGEVIVSADTAIREAGERGVDPVQEFALYLVHGMLHLCGYDDHEASDRRAMRDRERAILSQFDIVPTYDEE